VTEGLGIARSNSGVCVCVTVSINQVQNEQVAQITVVMLNLAVPLLLQRYEESVLQTYEESLAN